MTHRPTRQAAIQSSAARYTLIFAESRLAPARIPRLQREAWHEALARAASIPAVIEVVQQIVRARRAHGSAAPSAWQPREIRSREDIEHWERRIRSRPAGRPGVPDVAPLGDLMRFALERMNQLGPRRAAG